jgi:CRP-like cAMP-binding protein
VVDVVALPRGGLWLETPIGALQLGAPPETLKDTLVRKDGVPRIVVLPPRLVDVRRGVATADLEFPIYWNLFVKRRPLIVVGTPEQGHAIRTAVQESLLGPPIQDLRADVAPGHHVPDLLREMGWFRRGNYRHDGLLSLDDAVQFMAAAPGRPAQIVEDGHSIAVTLEREEIVVTVDGTEHARLPREPPLRATTNIAMTAFGAPPAHAPFSPPRFGVTVLGRSHGFDPDPRERTTGFVLWVGGRGVMVDPPVHSTQLLKDSDIDAGLVDSLILTHVHADHDAGTLQKALEAGRVTLFTAPVIFASWLRKWSALSGIPEDELRRLFDFHPVQVGRPVDVGGAKLLFRFTLHSIPTLAFEAHYEGASFNYSGDTLNDPQVVDQMYRAGCMDPERREELSHFDWSHDLVFHESGVPPLHTPLALLEALDDDIKRRLRVLHVTPARLVDRKGLIVAEPGREATIEIPVNAAPELRVLRRLALLGRTRLFSRLPLARAAELLAAARELRVPAGDRFIKSGDVDDVLYVVTGGKAAVLRDGVELKRYGLGDYIGETAVFLRRPRTADVVAVTDLDLLIVDGAVARRVCDGTDVPMMVARHAQVRDMGAWTLLDATDQFAGLTSTQKNTLETLLIPFDLGAGSRLIAPGVPADQMTILLQGRVVLDGPDHDDAPTPTFAREAAFVGDISALLAGRPQPHGAVVVAGRARGFFLQRHDLADFLDDNPGIRVRVEPWTAREETMPELGMARMVTEHVTDVRAPGAPGIG